MSVPERWQELIDLVLIPIAWVPRLQEALLAYFLAPGAFWITAAKYVFLLFPALLGVAAVWVTLLSLYTLPFRRYRLRFVSMMLLAWWDAARAVTLYWGGVVRVAAIAVGWVLTLAALGVRLLVDALHRLATTPVGMAGSRPPHSVPWVACAVLIAWCLLEAAVFTYATVPTVTRALNGVSGGGEESRFTAGVLYGFLLLLVMGSFACLQILTDAVRTRQVRLLVQMAAVQLLVMVFEVMFLYRPLVDVLIPMIAGQAGARVGPWSAMALAALAWGATRTLTWFLFAQHGAAPLLAFLARRQEAEVPMMRAAAPPTWWRPAAADFEREVEWLHLKGEQLTEYVALPVLQLVAAALNFALLVVASRPVFHLPFRAMREVTDTRDLLATLHLIPRKQTSL